MWEFVPFPIPPIGKVESGLLTLNNLAVTEATRESLPVPFSCRSLRVANLKRCLLVQRMPVGEGGKELVLINLHLEAYSDDAGRAAQMEMLAGILRTERNNGNYVIAGGDFNRAFPARWRAIRCPRNPSGHPGRSRTVTCQTASAMPLT